ncbi:MAG: M1 family metallopeptidase [Daejeonella sp.]|uniref:M1 family metallopeptidase n=1 Tax=Daejeonella sp. TaxID=2805397 RepID=UPI002735220B|nr:M1 family metallopeptidase [Daejeonella sp.]MDP3468995.1 M1 family metallopeptidase [Daejeonella sp.]
MFKLKTLILLILSLTIFITGSQGQSNTFTRADTLRGTLSPLRSSYDINYYHLNIKLDIENKKISGSNLFRFTAVQDLNRLQFDLFENMNVEKVSYRGKEIPFSREFNAVFIDFPESIKKGSKAEFTVHYNGNPTIAINAPWDGGFTFSADQNGKPWVSVACQGFGASSWWPNKDHQSDEVDSILISIAVPKGLMNVSNGRLLSVKDLKDSYTQYNWFVSYPINNYNVSLNVADYVHFDDIYEGENGKLSLDYYVLRENLEKAKKQFNANVKPMLSVFENWFGPYPFYRDGYKLIETPYLGMEHQSAIAYGNKYLNGYRGRDLSGTGLGLKWDYIIIHETGHEWFGNNITAQDIADMWIHEGFTMYSEALYVESREGKAAGAKYIAGIRSNIMNNKPLIGPYNVNKEGSGDMYYKGANLIHMTRVLLDDDKKWRELLRGMNKEFGLKTTNTEEIVNYINRITGKNMSKIYDQYLRFAQIPILEYKQQGNQVSYRWQADVKDFDMPIRIKRGNKMEWINPETEWKKIKMNAAFSPDTLNFYIRLKQIETEISQSE